MPKGDNTERTRFKAAWKTSKTKAIKIPEVWCDRIKDICKELDKLPVEQQDLFLEEVLKQLKNKSV